MFGNVFKPGDDDSKDNPQTIIFNNYYVPNMFVYGLVLLIFQLFSLSFAVFWENFLFKILFSCDDYIELLDYCFDLYDFSEINCSEVVPVSGVVCFRLAFDWSESLSATGGFFVAVSFLIAVLPWIVLKITKGDQATKKCKMIGKILRVFLIFIILVVAFVDIILLLIERKFDIFHTANLFQVVALYTTFIVIIAIPWWNFKKVINGVYMCDNDNMGTNVSVNSNEYQLITT